MLYYINTCDNIQNTETMNDWYLLLLNIEPGPGSPHKWSPTAKLCVCCYQVYVAVLSGGRGSRCYIKTMLRLRAAAGLFSLVSTSGEEIAAIHDGGLFIYLLEFNCC